MSFEDFLTAHREELVDIYAADLVAGKTPEQVGQHFTTLLVGMMQATAADTAPGADENELVGSHPSVSRARIAIDQLSRRSRTPVLVLGEFGTGKRQCVRALHAATYPEGELFELKGPEGMSDLERLVTRLRTRTSADATAGVTVFVHNLHESSSQVQTRVSELLREQALQMRLVASSTRSLTQACREGTLRSDLVFGFPTIIELSPLRDRISDVPALVEHFGRLGTRPALVFGDSALARLKLHAWPGNLAELKNLVQTVRDESRADVVEAEHLPELGDKSMATRFSLPPSGIDLAELERELLIQALSMTDNNQSRAARLLGLTRDQIRYRLAKFDLLQQTARV